MSYVFLFITGFLISRLSMRYELAEQFFARLFHARNHSVQRFLFYLLAAAAMVSMFTPNFIAALTLLPMLESLRQSFERNHNEKIARRLTTAVVIIVIYGCNIGGMGSLVGSPANAFMLAQMEIFGVAGREKINFLSWFGWSLPLAGVLLVMAWAQVAFIFLPAKFRREQIELPQFHQSRLLQGRAKTAWHMLVLWFAFWTVHSVLQILVPFTEPNFFLMNFKIGFTPWDQLATLFGVIYLALLFAPIFRTEGKERQALLKISDSFNKLPVRAFLFVLLVLAFSYILIQLKVPEWLGSHLVQILPQNVPKLVLYFCLLFITTMVTELVSNTTVALVLFPLVHALALSLGLSPFVAFLAVGLASTNAFMTPIGTPVNALLFGGVKNVSLVIMLASGLLLNFMSAVWMAIALGYWVPRYYGL